MKPTNYHIFDFLEIDKSFSDSSRIWKAGIPDDIGVQNGSVYLNIPFYCLKKSLETQVDEKITPKHYKLFISSYGPNILRCSIGFDKAIKENSPMLEFSKNIKKDSLTYKKHKDYWELLDGQGILRAKFMLSLPDVDHWSDLLPEPEAHFQAIFYPNGKKPVAINAFDQFFPARMDAIGLGFIEEQDVPTKMTYATHAEHDERFVGTGERFTKMDLSGQTFDLQNRDGQGVNNHRTYKNIPLLLSSKGYASFMHTSFCVKLSIADHSTRSVITMIDEPLLDLFLIGDESPERILYHYRCLTGFPPELPTWTYGIWMSRMTYFSEEEVVKICERLRTEKFPCDVIHLDTGWFRKDWLCEWTFNEDRFPNPKAFVQKLDDSGFKVSLWQMPYIADEAEQHDEALYHKYMAVDKLSENQQNSNFSTLDYAGTIDFTNPNAILWYQDLLKKLLDLGVACIKTDFGEDIHMQAEYQNMDAAELANLYALLYQKAAFEITEQVTSEPVIWARAGWAGCQRYPIHWGGDAAATWDGMAGSLKGGLHLGLSGFAYWSHDVPGFHGQPNFMNAIIPDDLYVRWTQFGVFSSHIRYHGTSKREPYEFPVIEDVIKQWWTLRYALIPYILEQAKIAKNTGFPLLRALLLMHCKDKMCWHIDDQYYFGEKFLVAPIMNSKNKRDVYLPEGDWINFFTGENVIGPKWLYDIETSLAHMPVWVARNSIITINPDLVQHTGELNPKNYVQLIADENFKGIWDVLQPLIDSNQ